MRPVLCSTWPTNDFRFNRASSQPSASAWLAGGSLSVNSASHAESNPAFTNVGARSQAPATPRSSSQLATDSARSLRARWSSSGALDAEASSEAFTRACQCSGSRALLRWQRKDCTLSVVSFRCAAARRAAAAGLFSSCAKPAAMVPRETSFSRCCE